MGTATGPDTPSLAGLSDLLASVPSEECTTSTPTQTSGTGVYMLPKPGYFRSHKPIVDALVQSSVSYVLQAQTEDKSQDK